MSEWKVSGNEILDAYGTPLAECFDDEYDNQIACQIVREHNTHDTLIGTVRGYRRFVCNHDEDSNVKEALLQHIDAVLARAEGENK